MDGRVVAALLTIVLPGALMGVTAEFFSTNPLAILGLFSVMVGGVLYILSYNESF
ncbi:MAG TPA: hypothetical protein VGV89_02080 [Thermoplasmata archaeon]|nr:hypothetical protein [Thermoplasmata archaeon]